MEADNDRLHQKLTSVYEANANYKDDNLDLHQRLKAAH